ncbi:MAG: prolyl oligopeptidase family serine peptidase [Flavobacteriales bacterium]
MKTFSRITLFALSSTFLFTFNSGFLGAQNGMTVEDVARTERISSAKMNGDASHVVYVRSIPGDPMKGEADSKKLYVYDVEEGEKRLYRRRSLNNVRFRPGHKSLTFLASGGEKESNAIYEIPLDGGAATELYRFDGHAHSFEWASDGKTFAFRKQEEGKKPNSPLPDKPEIYEEGLKSIQAFVTKLGNEDQKPLRLQVEGTVYTLRWSPDDSKLALSVAPTPRVDDYYMHKQVRVVNASNGKLLTEIPQKGKLSDIRWSPDGKKLAMVGGADIHDVIAGRILTVPADGGEIQNIKPDYKGKFEAIRWTEEGRIHFIASKGTQSAYGSIKPDGSDMKYTQGPGNTIFDSFSQADGKNAAFVVTKPEHPRELYIRKDGGDIERVTTSNEWLADKKLGDQRSITYEARDGKKIQGVLIEPVGYKEGESVPTIVCVHGGPESHFSNGWVTYYSRPGQVAAAKGYAVFYPNYRGSTGRGEKFLKSSQGDAGGKEFDDIVDGVKYLIDQGIAKKGKIGVTGGSYGGYATGWMATRYSKHFDAAVMNFGVSNNISKWGTSDIPMELYLVHAREYIWNGNWMKYLKRSPIYHVDKAQTPLLITHGKEDTRVHPAQSMELFRHMKVRKPEVPLRWVRYPEEGHGYDKPSHQYDYSIRQFRWFDHFLKEGKEEKPERSIEGLIPEDR